MRFEGTVKAWRRVEVERLCAECPKLRAGSLCGDVTGDHVWERGRCEVEVFSEGGVGSEKVRCRP